MQNQGLRLRLGAFRTSPMESLYVEANEPSLYNRREKLSFQYVLKLKSNPQNQIYQDTFHPKLTTTFENKPNTISTFGVRIEKVIEQYKFKYQPCSNLYYCWKTKMGYEDSHSPLIQKKTQIRAQICSLSNLQKLNRNISLSSLFTPMVQRKKMDLVPLP